MGPHDTPAIMVLGEAVGGRAFPGGAALVIEPAAPEPHALEAALALKPDDEGEPRVLGILVLAPLPGGGFRSC